MWETARQPRHSCVVKEEKKRVFVCSLPAPCSWLPGPVPPIQRYFVLEDGILHYATTRQDVSQVPGLGWGGACPRMF